MHCARLRGGVRVSDDADDRTVCPHCARSWRVCDCGEGETEEQTLDRETA